MTQFINNSLDLSKEDFEQLLVSTIQMILQKFEQMEGQKAFSGLSPDDIRSWLDEKLPEEGMDFYDVLNFTKEHVIDTATLNMAPKMFAYVMAGGTQMSIIAEMIATTINQNVGKWHLAPVMTEMEQQVAKWAADFIGYDPETAGVMVSGGSAANLTALTVARNVFFEKENIRDKGLFGLQPFTIYCSDETHNCVDKSADILGLGTHHLKKIATHDDFTIDLNKLEQCIKEDIKKGIKPFCLIGNAGTVNTGAIDDLTALGEIARRYGMWYHIDGAYGGLAASLQRKRPMYAGIESADSIALDFHKWLYQPFEAGCTLIRDWSSFRKGYYKKASYLATDMEEAGRIDFNEHQFQLSRNAKALKVWMSFKAYGAHNFRKMIDKDISLTEYLAASVNESDDFELITEALLGITCFRYIGKQSDSTHIDKLNKEIIPALENDGRVFITGTTLQNRPVIRACLINHRLQEQHLDHLISVIREVGEKVENTML